MMRAHHITRVFEMYASQVMGLSACWVMVSMFYIMSPIFRKPCSYGMAFDRLISKSKIVVGEL
jgi:hypothetical protein